MIYFKILKNEKGLTLIELVIVLAIISIIGAILAPNFLNATDRAKIKSDVQSVIVIQNTLDLYQIETGNNLHNHSIDDILGALVRHGYLNQRNKDSIISPQTEGAFWVNQNGTIKIDVSGVNAEILNGLNDNELSFLYNIPKGILTN